MRIRVWRPFPGLRVRVTHHDDGNFSLEVWRQIDPTTWSYQAVLLDAEAGKRVSEL